MANIVYGTQQVQIEIRFEMGLEKLISIHSHLVLIRVEDFQLWILIVSLHTLKQRVGRQDIVMVR